MKAILLVWNIVLTVAVIGLAVITFRSTGGAAPAMKVIRAQQIDLVDPMGKVRAQLFGSDATKNPALMLMDKDGRVSTFLTLNQWGYGQLVFNSKRIEGKVEVGYLWGSDTLGDEVEDPLASWGIRSTHGPKNQVVALGLPHSTEFVATSQGTSNK